MSSPQRSRRWSDSGEPPNWWVALPLLCGVVAIAILGIQLYLTRLAPPLAAVAENTQTGSPDAYSPPAQGGAESPKTADDKNDLIAQTSGTEPDPKTVTAAKVGPSSVAPRPNVVDPWPDLEVQLGQDRAEANKAFESYATSHPAPPRNPDRRSIGLCVLGDLGPDEERLLQIAREYLAITFDTPVRIQRRLRIADLPKQAVRFEERFNDSQLDSTVLLSDVLPAQRTPDSFALVGVTTVDPFPLPTAELLRWQGVTASGVSLVLLPRTANGRHSPDEARTAIRRVLAGSLHGVAPLFGLEPCSSMESGLHVEGIPATGVVLCPESLHQLCWNLDLAPEEMLRGQQRFFEKYGLREEAALFRNQLQRLQRPAEEASKAK